MECQFFFDLGMSGSKVIFNRGTSLSHYGCLPKVAELAATEVEILKSQEQAFGGGIDSGAYLEVAGQGYALADEAEGRRAKTTRTLPKSALAHLRILGAIGEFATKAKRSKLDATLGIALPFSEYLTDQAAVQRAVENATTFHYRGRKISLNLQTVKVLPEGAGLVQWRKFQALSRGEDHNRTYVVLILGHRDLTFLVFRNGKPPTGQPSESVPLGYVEFLSTIARGICEPEHPNLVDAVLRNADAFYLPERRGQAIALTERLISAKAHYWSHIEHYLSEKFATLDIPSFEVLIGGGGALQLQAEFAQYFRSMPYVTLNWLNDLASEASTALTTPLSQADRIRFADCYGGAKWLALKYPIAVPAIGAKS